MVALGLTPLKWTLNRAVFASMFSVMVNRPVACVDANVGGSPTGSIHGGNRGHTGGPQTGGTRRHDGSS